MEGRTSEGMGKRCRLELELDDTSWNGYEDDEGRATRVIDSRAGEMKELW